jgi:hypothetical protein
MLLLLAPSITGRPDSCSCSATDGSCSANVNCPGGCTAICLSGGKCRAVCLGGGGGLVEEDMPPSLTPTPTPSPTPSPTPIPTPSPTLTVMPPVIAFMTPSMLVTLKVTKADGKQVASALARAIDKDVEFLPYDVSRKFDFDYKDTPLWNVLEDISKLGKLRVGGIDFDDLQKMRHPLLSGYKVSMCIRNATVKDVMSYLSFLTGLPLTVVSGNTEARVSSTLKEVSFDEIITSVSAQTGVKIVMTGTATAKTKSSLE